MAAETPVLRELTLPRYTDTCFAGNVLVAWRDSGPAYSALAYFGLHARLFHGLQSGASAALDRLKDTARPVRLQRLRRARRRARFDSDNYARMAMTAQAYWVAACRLEDAARKKGGG